jgi:rRNA maturation protein Nop10
MFDITSWIRETIFRRPKLVQSIAGEELSEKQTTKLGYFLLFCMFVAIMSTAQWTLSIIHGIPERPTAVPACVDRVLSVFDTEAKQYSPYGYPYDYSYNSYNDCDLVSENPIYDLTTEHNTLEEPYRLINWYSDEIQKLESTRQNTQYRQENNREEYNTSLNERSVWEDDPLYDGKQIRQDITSTRGELTEIDAQISALQKKIDTLRAEYAVQVSQLKNKKEQAEDAYKRAYLVYRMIYGVLSLFFAGAVFAILYRLYVRRKIENSPHTIIFSVATFAYGIILLQILLMFLWEIIPHQFLEWLLGIISVFTPLLYLVQFLWPVIIVAVFGYLVYRIQKRLYSPNNVLKRFVMDKKCPSCGNAVDMNKPFCPLCSHEIHIHCPHCHELTMKWMPYCSNCGVELSSVHTEESKESSQISSK